MLLLLYAIIVVFVSCLRPRANFIW